MAKPETTTDAETSDEVTACWGEEKLQVAPYNTLTVGPFFYKTHRRESETPKQAFERAAKVVNYVGQTERTAKLASYRKVLAEIAE